MRVCVGDGNDVKVDGIERVAGDLAQAVAVTADQTQIEIVASRHSPAW